MHNPHTKYVTYETNRLLDIQYSTNIEQQHPVDYSSALKKYADAIIKAAPEAGKTTKPEQ